MVVVVAEGRMIPHHLPDVKRRAEEKIHRKLSSRNEGGLCVHLATFRSCHAEPISKENHNRYESVAFLSS